MTSPNTESLRVKKCLPCEGGVAPIDAGEAKAYIQVTPDWKLSDDAKLISRKVQCKHFVEAMKLLNRVAEVAEAEQHHPDLHLTGYRKVRIDLTTHAIDGLSENDFIVAAKIDEILEQAATS